MQEKYVKEERLVVESQKRAETELIYNIIKVREELALANKNFDLAEEELVDFYTYEIKAKKMQLDYLIKKAKSGGLIVDRALERQYRYLNG